MKNCREKKTTENITLNEQPALNLDANILHMLRYIIHQQRALNSILYKQRNNLTNAIMQKK